MTQGNSGAFTPDEMEAGEGNDRDPPRVVCSDCGASETIEDPTGAIVWYCADCGGRCEVEVETKTPEHVHSYQIS